MKNNINKYCIWSAVIVFLCTNVVWIIGWSAFSCSKSDPAFDKNQMYQEQIDRLSYIASLSAEMAILRKGNGNIADLDSLLQQVIEQIIINVVLNSIYEFDGENIVKFDILDGVFKDLVNAQLIDSEILESPLGIYGDTKNYEITHNFYSFNENNSKNKITADECKKFQKWFYHKIMNQCKED